MIAAAILVGIRTFRGVRHRRAGQAPIVTPQIIDKLPHDTAAFTQSLVFFDGMLYESTGLKGQSSLRCIDPKEGSIVKKIDMDDAHYAEGLALKDNRIIQLTWKDGIAFVYNLPQLERVGSMAYRGEGWGLTTDATHYLMSDGSDTITFRRDDFTVGQRLKLLLMMSHCRG